MTVGIAAEKYLYLSSATLLNQHGVSGVERNDDALKNIELLNLNEEWFDAKDKFDKPDDVNEKRVDAEDELNNVRNHLPANILAGEYADSQVPITEDLLRCVTQIVRMLGEAKKTELLSLLLAKIFPVVPFNIITAVNSLCTAIRENKQIDIAVLNTLSLASWCLPDDMNIVSRLAGFIRETIISWTGASFLRDGPGEDDGHQAHLYMALAVAAVVSSHFISGADAPQRALFRVPTFAVNLLLRAHMYWKALGAMVHNVTPPEEPAHPSAFEVETCIATTLRGTGAAGSGVSCAAQKVNVISFSSNSTVNPEVCTRATVENRTPKTPEAVHSQAEQAHALATARLMRESKLSALQNCITRQTVTRELRRGGEIVHTYLNTQCDATAYPDPLPVPVSQPGADDPPPPANSAAAELPCDYTAISMAAAGAAVAHGNPWTLALKSNVVRSVGAVTVLGGLALGGIAWWNAGTGGEGTPSADAHRGRRHHHRTKAEKINIRLARIMQSNGILDKAKRPAFFKKEEIIAAVGIALFAPNPEITYDATRLDKRLEEVAKVIQEAENPSNGWSDEKISAGRADMVVRNWVCENLLGMSLESWLARRVAASPGDVKTSQMQCLLRFDALRSAGIIDTEGLSDGKKIQLENLWNDVLDNTLPFTNFPAANGVKTSLVTDDDFVWLHTGSLLLKDAGVTLSDFSVEECQTVGKALLQRVEAGETDIHYMRYLTLPALLFEGVNHPNRVSHRKKNTFARRVRAVSDYAEYRATVSPVYANLRARVEALNETANDWKPRGGIADRYVDQCPDDVLIQLGGAINPRDVLGDGVAAKWRIEPSAELLRLGKVRAWESYLNDVTPWGCPDVSVTAEFERKTLALANAFANVDKYMLAVAMGGLDIQELNFINSGRAAFWQIAPSVRPPWFPGRPFKPELKNKNIFLVRVGTEERIYAFVGDKGGEYAIRRLDRKMDNYFRYGIFDTPGDESRRAYELDLPGYVSFIDVGNNACDDVVTHFATIHGLGLDSQLERSGYDMTLQQQAFEFLKSLIPFYRCFNGNIISCLIDVVSFIPVAGPAASLAGRFGLSLFRATKLGIKLLPSAALSTNIAKTIGQQALAQISLPTIYELTSLSKAAIRALDPGFELIIAVGKYSGAGLKTLFNKLRLGLSAADAIKLNRVLDRVLEKIEKPGAIEQAISHEELLTETVNLPGTNIKVPVRVVGEADRKNYYKIVDPETMETMKEIYVVEKGELVVVRQRPDNWSPKDDIRKQESAPLPIGEKKVDPAAPPSKDEVIASLCPTGTRVKRSFDELCRARPFEEQGWNTGFDMPFGREIIPSSYKVSLLRKVNPVRYKILQTCLNNLRDIALNAERVITEMRSSEIMKSFGFATKIPLQTLKQAETLRKNVLKTIKSISFFWANDATHIVLASFPEGSAAYEAETLAAYLPGRKAMVIGDAAFNDKNQGLFEMILLHEASHVDECVDNFYFLEYPGPKSGFPSIMDASQKSGTDVTSYNTFYMQHLKRTRGLQSLEVADDLKRKLGISLHTSLKASDHRVMDGAYRLGITLADLMVEDADSVAFYILHLGHKPDTFHWKSANDLFNKAESDMSFSDSVAAIGLQG